MADPRRREVAAGLFAEHLDLAAIRRALAPPEPGPLHDPATDRRPASFGAAPDAEAVRRDGTSRTRSDHRPARAAKPIRGPASLSAAPPTRQRASRLRPAVTSALALGLLTLAVVGALDGPAVTAPPRLASAAGPLIDDLPIAPAALWVVAPSRAPRAAESPRAPRAVLTSIEPGVALLPDDPLPEPGYSGILLPSPALSRPGPVLQSLARPPSPASPLARPASLASIPVPPTAAALRDAPRVVIHYSAAQGRAAGDGLTAVLTRAGFSDLDWRAVPFGVSRSNIRYFHPGDAKAGQAVATAVSGAGMPASLRDFTHYTPRPSSGTIEIWIGG